MKRPAILAGLLRVPAVARTGPAWLIGEAGLIATAAVSAGGSDANVLNARGLPTVNLGIGAQNGHGDDEFVLLEDFAACARIAHALVRPDGDPRG